MANGLWAAVLRFLAPPGERKTPPSRTRTTTLRPGRPPRPAEPQPGETTDYAGDFTGRATISYTPDPDGHADPGEVVWAWVPFEEDHSQGKDRPVLIIARHRKLLLGLMLTSQDHDRDAAQEARHGRVWMDVGTGSWDRQGRPSEVRLDRVLQLRPEAVRREGAALAEPVFDQVAAALRKTHGW